jgi:8-oxo-dGTP pyrophosphatase MutT (NUDIX family)
MLKRLIRRAWLNYRQYESREAHTELPIQTGALPWRRKKKGVEVLLVTGRRSRRWTIPKGWPMPGKSLAEAAAQEAFEEAGVKGTIDPEPLGSFRHTKTNLAIGDLDVTILVHPMSVELELPKWPELGQRKRKWFKPEDAADRVDSEELRVLIMRSVERALAAPASA